LHRLWQPLLGSLCFLGFPRLRPLFYSTKYNVALLLLYFLVLCTILFSPSLYLPDDFARIVVSFTTGIFLLSSYSSLNTSPSRPPQYLLPLQAVGKISYSLYLWHWGILVLCKWFLIPLDILSYSFLTLAFSLFSYYAIEAPFRGAYILSNPILTNSSPGKSITVSNRLSLFIAFLSLVVSIGVLRTLQKSNFFFRFPQISSLSPWVFPFDYPVGKGGYSSFCKTFVTDHSESMECDLPPSNKVVPTRDIVIVGDSHASNNIPSVIHAIQGNTSLSSSFRKLYFVPLFSDTVRIDNSSKLLSQLIYVQSIVNLRSVLIFQLDPQRLRESYSWSSPVDPTKLATLQTYLKQLAQIALSTNSSFLTVAGSPRPCEGQLSSYDMDTYILKYFKAGLAIKCSYPMSVAVERNASFNTVVSLLSSDYPSLKSVDFYDSLCPRGFCVLVRDGRLLYADLSPHFSSYYSSYLSPDWQKLLLREL